MDDVNLPNKSWTTAKEIIWPRPVARCDAIILNDDTIITMNSSGLLNNQIGNYIRHMPLGQVWCGENLKVLLNICKRAVRSRLDYGCQEIFKTSQVHWNKLNRVQFQTVRIAIGCSRSTSTKMFYWWKRGRDFTQ